MRSARARAPAPSVFDREITDARASPATVPRTARYYHADRTRDILAHATRQSESHEDYFLVDMDAHVTETSFWPEILALIDNDVIRQMGEANAARPGNANTRCSIFSPAF